MCVCVNTNHINVEESGSNGPLHSRTRTRNSNKTLANKQTAVGPRESSTFYKEIVEDGNGEGADVDVRASFPVAIAEGEQQRQQERQQVCAVHAPFKPKDSLLAETTRDWCRESEWKVTAQTTDGCFDGAKIPTARL